MIVYCVQLRSQRCIHFEHIQKKTLCSLLHTSSHSNGYQLIRCTFVKLLKNGIALHKMWIKLVWRKCGFGTCISITTWGESARRSDGWLFRVFTEDKVTHPGHPTSSSFYCLLPLITSLRGMSCSIIQQSCPCGQTWWSASGCNWRLCDRMLCWSSLYSMEREVAVSRCYLLKLCCSYACVCVCMFKSSFQLKQTVLL